MLIFKIFFSLILTMLSVNITYADNYYHNKRIRIVLGTNVSPTAGFELNTRIFAKYFSQHIPGNPEIIINNMPGGAGVTATNFVNLDTEGFVIGSPLNTVIMSGLFERESNTNYNIHTLNWIGSTDDYSNDTNLLYVRNDVNVLSDIIIGETSRGKIFALPHVYNSLVNNQSRIVYGYKSKQEIILAFLRGEVNAINFNYSNMSQLNTNEILKISKPIAQFGHRNRISHFKDVPTLHELVDSEEKRLLIEVLENINSIARPFHLGSKVEQYKINILRESFMKTCQDKRLIDELRKLDYNTNCISGDNIQQRLIDIENTKDNILPLIDKHLLKRHRT